MSAVIEGIKLKHHGMADASSAIAIGSDKFLVVTDEKNHFVLYNAFKSGEPIASYDFSCFLDLDAEDAEADVEGSASVGPLTFWIGSHSRDKHGRVDLNRHQFFATSIDETRSKVKVRQVGQSYTNLLFDLGRLENFKELIGDNLIAHKDATLSPKAAGAISIEGLTQWKRGVLVGFRNPLHRNGNALLLPVLNPLEMVLYGDRARFGDLIPLDLGNRGIRSIDALPGRSAYLIAAGSFDHKLSPAYYVWDGSPDSKPEPYTMNLPEQLNTEAVVIYEDLPGIQLLSDDGDEFKDKKVKDEERFFRSVWIDNAGLN